MSLFISDYLIHSLKRKHIHYPYNYGEGVRKETDTKIHGLPKNQDLTILEKELIAILANIPMTLGEENHGHAGILKDPARYLLTGGVPFTNPANLGNYPAGLPGNAAAGVQARAEA